MIPKRAAAALAAELPGQDRQVMRLVINQVAAARGLSEPWPIDLTEPDAARVRKRIKELGDLTGWSCVELGMLREHLMLAADRNAAGVWYTPPEVAEFMARFTLAGDQVCCGAPGCAIRVMALDPACGAGVFLIAAARQIAKVYAQLLALPDEPPPWSVQAVLPTVISHCIYGIDIDPVAVDLAKSALWLEIGGTRPIGWLDDNIIAGDTLAGDSPQPLEDRLGDLDPLIILGNPPYREHAKGSAPWIEARRGSGEELNPRPSLDEFRAPGNGRNAGTKLNSLYVYFWRWALWKALETRPAGGTVALISPSSFVDKKSYTGMREHLRRVADEGWVIDLSPEGHQPPVKNRIFPGVKTPLAIGIFTKHVDRATDAA